MTINKKSYILKIKKINNRYNLKIKEYNRSISELEIKTGQIPAKISKTEKNINALSKKAEEKKKEKLAEIQPLITEIVAKIEKSKEKYENLKQEEQIQVDEKKEAKNLEIDKIDSQFQNKMSKLNEQKENLDKNYKTKCKTLEEDRIKELEGKIDTNKLKKLEEDISEFEKKLESVEKLKLDAAVYKSEKLNYIDKLPDFKVTLEQNKSKLEEITKEFNDNKQVFEKQKSEIEKELEKTNENIKNFKSQIKDFDKFKESFFYINPDSFDNRENEIPTEESLTTLINAIRNLYHSIEESFKTLKSHIKAFVSPLRDDNIFEFSKTFKDDNEYRLFSDNLKEFISEKKIEEYERKISKVYGDLMNRIVQETNKLLTKKKEIDEVISRMNKDFKKSNFIGVVQKIELKTDPSENKVFQTLKQIQQFHFKNSENSFGELNLFTESKLDEKNNSEFKLLTSLIKNLRQTKDMEISIEDTFELKFKIIENNKDTGWQVKLADIGSKGTDVLVKAMLYIMLLNVFKEKASKKQQDFKLHCIMDEINTIHPKNIESLIHFANNHGIWVIHASPVVSNALAYKHVYNFAKTKESITYADKMITVQN